MRFKKAIKLILKKTHLINFAKKIKNKYFYRVKIGASYSVFDGLELLEASLRTIRESVDYINVVFQEYSYFNNKCDKNAIKFLNYLKEIKLIDTIIFYKVNLNLTPRENELNKRNLGLKDCIKNKCNYFMTMDVDEFFEKRQFENAKKFIINNKIDLSACQFYCYLKTPHYRFAEPRKSFMMPFLGKINKFSFLEYNSKNLFCRVDCTRMLRFNKNKKTYVFSIKELIMHHMCYIRSDLFNKYNNTSAKGQKEVDPITLRFINDVNKFKYPGKILLYDNDLYDVVKVDDIFNVASYFNKFIEFFKKN